MITTSHAYSMWRLSARHHHRSWRTFGAVLPDAPGWVIGAVLRARGLHGAAFIARLYHSPPFETIHDLAHGAPFALTLLAGSPRGSRRRAVAEGWLAHLAADALTHHTDAWPLLWPVSRRTWSSPVSYWERDHHAGTWILAELTVLAATARPTPVLAALTAAATASSRWTWPPR